MSLKQLITIPAVHDFLLDGAIFEAFQDICTKYNLPPERAEEFMDLCDAVLDGQLPLEHMPELIVEAFAISEDTAKKVAADVAGHRLLPLADFLPGIEEHIAAWGGKVAEYPSTKIKKPRVTPRSFAQDAAKNLNLKLDDVLIKRLAFLIEQLVTKKKDEASVRTFFGRASSIGGMGFTPEQAGEVLMLFKGQTAEWQLVDEPEPQPQPQAEIEVLPEQPPVTVPEVALSHEIVAEVPLVNAPESEPVPVPEPVVAPKSVIKKPFETPLEAPELKVSAKKAAAVKKVSASSQDALAQAVDTALGKVKAVLKKKKLPDKDFVDAATKAVKGLRDVYQTRDIFERDLGLAGDDLVRIMTAVSEAIEQYHQAHPVEKILESPVQEVAPLIQRKVRLEEPAKPAPAKARLTVGSVSLQTETGQRKMVDVVATQRLMGPIEQLGTMTTTEFRRLSSNASEAAQKIEDLLTALEQTSYEDRVKGVLAWRESPMNQLYLQMAEQALSQGISIPEMSSRRRAAGQESLSPAEMKALALLNAKIRF